MSEPPATPVLAEPAPVPVLVEPAPALLPMPIDPVVASQIAAQEQAAPIPYTEPVIESAPAGDQQLIAVLPVPVGGQPAVAADTIQPGWSISFARIGEELLAWFKTLLSAAVYATLIVTFGFQVARVEGQSMVPTLEDQDRLIVNKLAYRLGEPRVGDIVMLYYPEDPSKSFVKRIVAEPGDTIKIVDGRVLRNDVPLADDFIPEKYRDHDNLGPFVLPRGYYYVMGDHRNNSSDSRTWGYVPKRYIIGKVQLRWWPVNSAKVF